MVRIGTEKRAAFCRWHGHLLKHPRLSALHRNLCHLHHKRLLRNSKKEPESVKEKLNSTELKTCQLNFHLADTTSYTCAPLGVDQVRSAIFSLCNNFCLTESNVIV